jgi:hypothetical protein
MEAGGGQQEAVEREQFERVARLHDALAAAQDRVYWLDRWDFDLNSAMQGPAARLLRLALKMGRGLQRVGIRARRDLRGELSEARASSTPPPAREPRPRAVNAAARALIDAGVDPGEPGGAIGLVGFDAATLQTLQGAYGGTREWLAGTDVSDLSGAAAIVVSSGEGPYVLERR